MTINRMITIPMGVAIMDEILIQGELVRCDVIAGSGQKAAPSKGLGAIKCWALLLAFRPPDVSAGG